MNGTPHRITLLDSTYRTLDTNNQPLQAPSSSPSPLLSPSPSQQEQPGLHRQHSEISIYDQKQSSERFVSDIGNAPWTRKQWETLELWYDKMDRDCQRASSAFYRYESTVSESDHPLWSKEYILWRCQCLDTNTKYHCGVLPSERKRRKDLQRKLKKQDLLKRQSTSQLQQQQPSQTTITKNKGTSSNSSSSKGVRDSNTFEIL